MSSSRKEQLLDRFISGMFDGTLTPDSRASLLTELRTAYMETGDVGELVDLLQNLGVDPSVLFSMDSDDADDSLGANIRRLETAVSSGVEPDILARASAVSQRIMTATERDFERSFDSDTLCAVMSRVLNECDNANAALFATRALDAYADMVPDTAPKRLGGNRTVMNALAARLGRTETAELTEEILRTLKRISVAVPRAAITYGCLVPALSCISRCSVPVARLALEIAVRAIRAASASELGSNFAPACEMIVDVYCHHVDGKCCEDALEFITTAAGLATGSQKVTGVAQIKSALFGGKSELIGTMVDALAHASGKKKTEAGDAACLHMRLDNGAMVQRVCDVLMMSCKSAWVGNSQKLVKLGIADVFACAFARFADDDSLHTSATVASPSGTPEASDSHLERLLRLSGMSPALLSRSTKSGENKLSDVEVALSALVRLAGCIIPTPFGRGGGWGMSVAKKLPRSDSGVVLGAPSIVDTVSVELERGVDQAVTKLKRAWSAVEVSARNVDFITAMVYGGACTALVRILQRDAASGSLQHNVLGTLLQVVFWMDPDSLLCALSPESSAPRPTIFSSPFRGRGRRGRMPAKSSVPVKGNGELLSFVPALAHQLARGDRMAQTISLLIVLAIVSRLEYGVPKISFVKACARAGLTASISKVIAAAQNSSGPLYFSELAKNVSLELEAYSGGITADATAATLRTAAEAICSAKNSGEAVKKLEALRDAVVVDGGASPYELAESGVAQALLKFFTEAPAGTLHEQCMFLGDRVKAFAQVFMDGALVCAQNGADGPEKENGKALRILVGGLIGALSFSGEFCQLDFSKFATPSTSLLSQSFKLSFRRAAGEQKLKEMSGDSIGAVPLASKKAIIRYLRDKIGVEDGDIGDSGDVNIMQSSDAFVPKADASRERDLRASRKERIVLTVNGELVTSGECVLDIVRRDPETARILKDVSESWAKKSVRTPAQRSSSVSSSSDDEDVDSEDVDGDETLRAKRDLARHLRRMRKISGKTESTKPEHPLKKLWDHAVTIEYFLVDDSRWEAAYRARHSHDNAIVFPHVAPVSEHPLPYFLATYISPAPGIRDAATTATISLLDVLYRINNQARSLILSENSALSSCLDAPIIAPRHFVSHDLSVSLTRQLSDPLASLFPAALPAWCHTLATSRARFLLDISSRRRYFVAARCNVHNMVSRTNNVALFADKPDVPAQRAIVSRRSILSSALKLANYIAPSSQLEIIFGGEVGVGSGLALEFFSMVGRDLQQRSLHLFVDNSDEHGSDMDTDGKEGNKTSGFVTNAGGLYPDIIENPVELVELTSSIPTDFSVSSAGGVRPSGSVGGEKAPAAPKEQLYFLLGMLIAQALVNEKLLLDAHIAKPLLKWLTGVTLAYEDLADAHTYLFRSLKPLVNAIRTSKTDIDGCPIEDLFLTMTVPGRDFRELCPGGASKTVTADTLSKYVSLLVNEVLACGVSESLTLLAAGFQHVIGDVAPANACCVGNNALLPMFEPYELGIELEGEDDTEPWSADDILAATTFDHGYTRECTAAVRLAKVLASFSATQRRLFLLFVTGTPRLPIGGFKALNPPFTVSKKNSVADSTLPSSSTCFNLLKIPDYSSETVLRDKLLFAICNGQGSFDLS